MAKEKTESSRFESRFGGGFITNAQFLAENMVAKGARRRGIELPAKFWNLDRYKREFLMQLRFANSLLKLYSIDTILFVLRTEGKSAYTLNARWLDPIFTAEQKKRNLQESERLKQAETKVAEKPVVVQEKERPVFIHSQSELDKLRNL